MITASDAETDVPLSADGIKNGIKKRELQA